MAVNYMELDSVFSVYWVSNINLIKDINIFSFDKY